MPIKYICAIKLAYDIVDHYVSSEDMKFVASGKG